MKKQSKLEKQFYECDDIKLDEKKMSDYEERYEVRTRKKADGRTVYCIYDTWEVCWSKHHGNNCFDTEKEAKKAIKKTDVKETVEKYSYKSNISEAFNQLTESQDLNEAWSSSMPRWLSDALKVDIESVSPQINKLDTNRYRARSSRPLNRRYSNAREYGSPRTIELVSLFGGLRDKGLDLNNATFIETDVPTSSHDVRLKDPYIAFLKLPYSNRSDLGDVVYSPGINDYQQIYIDHDLKNLKSIPMKNLLNIATGFCYVDTSDPKNMTDKYIEREKEYSDIVSNINNLNPFIRKSDFGRNAENTTLRGRVKNLNTDKSGYIINPNKYRDILMKKNMEEPFKAIEKIYQRVLKIKDKVIDVLKNSSIFEISKSNPYMQSGDISNYLFNICNIYNNLVKQISNYSDDEQLMTAVKQATERIDNYEKELNKLYDKNTNVSVDWDTPYDENEV